MTNAPLHPFRVRSATFEGPLDVLVELVRRGELSALDLALSDVVVSYLQTLRIGERHDFEEVGEFLVLVATLLEIKSRLLLPDAKPPKSDARSAPVVSTRQQIVQHVAEIRRVEEAAAFLADRSRERRKLMRRLADDLSTNGGDSAGTPGGLELWDLVTVFSRMIGKGTDAQSIVRDDTPIAVYQDRIGAEVFRMGRMALSTLFADDASRAQRIGKFIALLEMIKSQRLWIEWDVALAELVVTPAKPISTTAVRSMQPMPPPLLMATADPHGQSTDGEDVLRWPDLPQVPEFPKRRNPWDGYLPLRRRDEPPQQFASH